MKNILIFSAHPDDAELSMGGTLLKLAQENNVIVVISSIPNDVEARIEEAKKIENYHKNIRSVFIQEGLGKQISNIPMEKLVSNIDEIILRIHPDIIFTNWNHDAHYDHRILTEAVFSSCRNFKGDIIMYDIANLNTYNINQFSPNFFVDITDYINEKKEIILNHKTQFHQSFHRDKWINYIAQRNRMFGINIDKSYAEGFIIWRKVD